tara:strand:+ start:407 stop:544 length:138 start_codon:yes stop_codon:yes gene_type:complete
MKSESIRGLLFVLFIAGIVCVGMFKRHILDDASTFIERGYKLHEE